MKKLLAALLMAPTIAHAGFLTGNQFYTRMTSDDVSDRIYALGYISGVYDTSETINHCGPTGITVGQARDVVKLYFDQNPDIRNLHADVLIKAAMKKAWPCGSRRSS